MREIWLQSCEVILHIYSNLFITFRSEPELPREEPAQPLPQPTSTQAPHSHPGHSDDNQDPHKPSHTQFQWDHVAARGANPPTSTNPSEPRYPRRVLRKLPSGVTPLWDNLQDNVKQLKPQTSKILQEGGKKMNKALQGVRTSLSSLSQVGSSTGHHYIGFCNFFYHISFMEANAVRQQHGSYH